MNMEPIHVWFVFFCFFLMLCYRSRDSRLSGRFALLANADRQDRVALLDQAYVSFLHALAAWGLLEDASGVRDFQHAAQSESGHWAWKAEDT